MPGVGNTAGKKTDKASALLDLKGPLEENIVIKGTFTIIADRKCLKKTEDNVMKNDVRGK